MGTMSARRRLRNRPQCGRAHDVVIFELRGSILLRVRGSILTDITYDIEICLHLVGPVTRDYHAWILDGTFRHVGGAVGIRLVSKWHPVVHDRSARVDGEAKAIAILPRK